MTDNTVPDPESPELAGLRGRLRGRWKAERRDQEHEALDEHWAARNLIDAMREAMDHGDRVVIHLPGPRTLSGFVVHVGQDYVAVRSSVESREYAVRLGELVAPNSDPYGGPSLYVEIRREEHPEPGPPGEDPPPTFQAVLQQHAFHQQAKPGRLTEVGTRFHPHGLRCIIRARSGDHLYAQDVDGHDLLIPSGILTYVSWAAREG